MPLAAEPSHCYTPEPQPPLAGRPRTPDTANLLQRALASSGSVLLNSLSQVSSGPQAVSCDPCQASSLKAPVAAAVSDSAQPSGSVTVPVSRLVPGAIPASSSGTSVPASLGLPEPAHLLSAVSIQATLVPAKDSHQSTDITCAPLVLADALAKPQIQRPTGVGEASKEVLSFRQSQDGMHQQQKVEASAAKPQQLQNAIKPARLVEMLGSALQAGQDQRPCAVQQGSAQQQQEHQQSHGLSQAEESHDGKAALQERAGPSFPLSADESIAVSACAGHVTSQVLLCVVRHLPDSQHSL